MNRLPFETLVDIFSRLAFKDKLQCALTCRDWYTKISSTVLYTHVSFSIEYPQYEDFTKARIQSMYEQGLGLQIVDLRVRHMSDPLKISELCPNLKSLTVYRWEDEGWKDNVYDWDYNDHWRDSDNESLVKNWPNLEVIDESCNEYHVTMKLLATPLYMMSLRSVAIGFRELSEQLVLRFIKQLTQAPALEHLSINYATNLNYKRLDLLHENAPNLKDLELHNVDRLIVERGQYLEEHRPLSMNLSVVRNLRSLCVDFAYSSYHYDNLRPHQQIINDMHWIEYICRKYTNLSRISAPSIRQLKPQHRDIISGYLKNALCNWTQLKTLGNLPVYFSADILQVMDDSNICLEAISVCIRDEADMNQLFSLAHSKQRNIIHTLRILGITTDVQGHLPYFFQALDKTSCQLKMIDITMNYSRCPFDVETNALTPIQILNNAPLLQTLSIPWFGTRAHINISQTTTHLTYLDLQLVGPSDTDSVWRCSTQQHIQDIIYASPLLQTLSIIFRSKIHLITLDLQRNLKLSEVRCYLYRGETIAIMQNSQTKSYTYQLSDPKTFRYQLIQEPQKKDSVCNLILHLPPTIRSLVIRDIKYSL